MKLKKATELLDDIMYGVPGYVGVPGMDAPDLLVLLRALESRIKLEGEDADV